MRISDYYNSKYIDAEETDVSRNQTSTWLMKAEVVSKEEIYSLANRRISFIPLHCCCCWIELKLRTFWRVESISVNLQQQQAANAVAGLKRNGN